MTKLQKEGRAKAEEAKRLEEAKADKVRKAEEARRLEESKGKNLPARPGVYKGEPNAMGILRDILEKHPDIGEPIKEEILDWARLRGLLDPQTVAYLLGQMKGVSSHTANIIAQKYALALQNAQIEGRSGGQVQIIPPLQPQQPQFQVPGQGYPPQPTPYVQSAYPPYQSPVQPQLGGVTREEISVMMSRTRDDFTKAVHEMLKEDKTEREKETLGSILSKSIERQDKLFEKIEKGELFPKPAVAPPTKEEIAEMAGKAASSAAAKVVEVKAKEDREERRHAELLSTIRTGVSAREGSGYKEDSYRLLGQSISSAVGAFGQREPIKIILQHVPEILYGAVAPPGSKELVPGATGEEMAAVVDKIKPEWVLRE